MARPQRDLAPEAPLTAKPSDALREQGVNVFSYCVISTSRWTRFPSAMLRFKYSFVDAYCCHMDNQSRPSGSATRTSRTIATRLAGLSAILRISSSGVFLQADRIVFALLAAALRGCGRSEASGASPRVSDLGWIAAKAPLRDLLHPQGASDSLLELYFREQGPAPFLRQLRPFQSKVRRSKICPASASVRIPAATGEKPSMFGWSRAKMTVDQDQAIRSDPAQNQHNRVRSTEQPVRARIGLLGRVSAPFFY